LITSKDWSTTALGNADNWFPNLKLTVPRSPPLRSATWTGKSVVMNPENVRMKHPALQAEGFAQISTKSDVQAAFVDR
jgi:hypothetical protein